MAVTLRLSRHGQKNRPFYRIVATETTNRRDGKFIEIVGTLNTMTEPAVAVLNAEKVKKWIKNGARYSLVVKNIIKKEIPGLIEAREDHQTKKVQTARKARKVRVAAAAAKSGKPKVVKEKKTSKPKPMKQKKVKTK